LIITNNLTKIYKIRDSQDNFKKKDLIAINHLNLEIKKGEIFGLIGPNGAGKTTLLKTLSTLILPDEGTAIINGFNVVKEPNMIKNQVSLLAGEFVRSLYWRLNGRQNLRFFANLRNIWNPESKIDELVDMFSLKKFENELVMKYSTGMKHKLALAVGLLNDPPVIFLDEPLTGIDPATAFEIKNLIRTKFKDKTIIWTTHNLYEMEEMCDRIALIKDGKIHLDGSPNKLKKDYWGYEKIMVSSNNSNAFSSIKKAEIKGNIVEIETDDVNRTFLEITDLAKQKNVTIEEIKTLKPTLEEIFMKGIGNA